MVLLELHGGGAWCCGRSYFSAFGEIGPGCLMSWSRSPTSISTYPVPVLGIYIYIYIFGPGPGPGLGPGLA